MGEFISERDLAAELGVSRSVLYGLRRKGLRYYKIGLTTWYHEAEVAEFIRARCARHARCNQEHASDGETASGRTQE